MSFAILKLDISGNPVKWINVEDAIHHYASGQVVFDLGETLATLHGGYNKDGVQSQLSTKSIIAVRGEIGGTLRPHANLGRNDYLFRRDHYTCAYCGDVFRESELTREHIIPRSRGGKDTWMNLVTACSCCNRLKADRTPEEAGMQLLFVPYVPSRWEGFILANRKILTDQMDYLAAKLPKTSRWALS